MDQLKSALDKKLAEYRTIKGINFKYDSTSLDKALNLSKLEVQNLPYEELCAYAYSLNGYSLYLQQELNSLSADLKWINHHILVLVGKYALGIGDKYTPYELRKSILLVENEHGIKLNSLLLEASIRYEQLNNLSSKVYTIASTLLAKGRKYDKQT